MMKRVSILILAVLLVGLFSSRAHAQGTSTNQWADTYPKAGTTAGTVLVKGKVTADTGWSITGTGTIVYWVSGGAIQNKAISVNTTTGEWEDSVTGLTTGTTYNFVVQCNIKSGMIVYTLATSAKTATAP